MPRTAADDAEVPVDHDPAARQEDIAESAEAIEAQKAVRLDGLHDEPDLVQMRADHQSGMWLAAILHRGDVPIAIDVDPVCQSGHATLEILHEWLLEAGCAMQRGEI